MKDKVSPLRVLFKAVFLFVAINMIFALANPPVGKFTLYNRVFPGRLRFPYEQEPQFYSIGYNAPVYEDFDAMFGAHIISKEKPKGEFRVVLLGDSSTWSINVQSDEMLSEQINRHNIQTCDGREVRVYNLGYPMPFLIKDLLILDKAMEYKPDMILWLVTLSTLEPKRAETYFVLPHTERFLKLIETYGISPPEFAEPIQERSFYKRTLVGQRIRLKNIVFNQVMGILWSLTGIDNHEGLGQVSYTPNPDVGNDLSYEKMLPGDDASAFFESLMMDVVSAGYAIADEVPVVLVNLPICIADGLNSDVRYNETYPQWIYDQYRQFISDWTNEQGQLYLDFWNTIPPSDFADQNFHRNVSGENNFADQLTPELQKLVCP